MVTCCMMVTTIYVHDGCQDNETMHLRSLAIVMRFLFHTLKPPSAQILGAMSPVHLNCIWFVFPGVTTHCGCIFTAH
jgi:hypothetical protein